jgi:glycosylphosphatidylinositol transamidase
MPTPSAPGLSTQRVLSYVNRLPLFTRGVAAVVVLAEVAALACRGWWDVRAWGALVPDETGFATRRLPLLLSYFLHTFYLQKMSERCREGRSCPVC